MEGVYKLYGFPATVGGAVSMNAGAYGYEISAYRNSPFPKYGIVTEATFCLYPSDISVREEISKIKRDRLMKQPINMPTSGSTFKNPKEAPAGLLLEKFGMKGFRKGNVMFSDKHANFLINLGGGTFDDVIYLINKAVDAIKEEAGIVLEKEVRLIEDSGVDGWKIL